MSDLAINEANDLVLVNGDLSLVRGSEAIAQAVQQRLQMFQGEWFLDTTQGVPWFQNILVQAPNLDIVNATLQNAILTTPGITELVAFDLSYLNSTRALRVTFQAKTIKGTVVSLTTAVGV